MGTFKVLLITTALLALSQATILDSNMKNVLATLPKAIVLDSVSNNSTPICNGFWQKWGYSCSPKKTIEFNTKDQKRFMKETQILFILLNRLGTIWSKESKHFQKLPQMTKQVFESFANPVKIKEIKKTSHECWNHMKKFRSTSLCFACSAINHKFYWKQRGLITMDSCKNMIDSCIDHFGLLVSLQEIVHHMEKILNSLEKHKVISGSSAATLKTYFNSTRAEQMGRLGELLAERIREFFSKNSWEEKTKRIFRLHKEICEKTIMLRHRPMILDFFEFLNVPVTKIYKAIVSKNKKQPTTSRALGEFDDWNTWQSWPTILPGFSEITVLSDRTVAENIYGTPMNMSLAFP